MRSIKKRKIKNNIVNGLDETVTGFLTPIAWDEFGDINEYSIFTVEGDDIQIKSFKNYKKLEKFVNKRVIAKGYVFENKKEEKCMNIRIIQAAPWPSTTNIFKEEAFRSIDSYDEFTYHAGLDYLLHRDFTEIEKIS